MPRPWTFRRVAKWVGLGVWFLILLDALSKAIDGMSGIIILVGITLGVAIICHWRIRKYWAASFLAAGVANVVLQIVSYVELGHLDKFFLITIFLGSVYAFALSLVVGIPFTLRRRARQVKPGFCQTCGYNLTGNESGKCPECSTRVPKQEATA